MVTAVMNEGLITLIIPYRLRPLAWMYMPRLLKFMIPTFLEKGKIISYSMNCEPFLLR